MNRFAVPATAVGAIGAFALTVGGLGVAAAANGGSLVLGHSNSATSTTTLSDSRGTPLSLEAKHGRAPLQVNSSKKVKHLNADELDGSSAAGLATAGSGASTHFGENLRGIVPTSATLVARTRGLGKGTYYVNASASASFDGGATGLACFVTAVAPTTADLDNASRVGTGDGGGDAAVPITAVMTVKAGQRISLYCAADGPVDGPQAEISNAGLTAIRIAHAVKGTTLHGSGVA